MASPSCPSRSSRSRSSCRSSSCVAGSTRATSVAAVAVLALCAGGVWGDAVGVVRQGTGLPPGPPAPPAPPVPPAVGPSEGGQRAVLWEEVRATAQDPATGIPAFAGVADVEPVFPTSLLTATSAGVPADYHPGDQLFYSLERPLAAATGSPRAGAEPWDIVAVAPSSPTAVARVALPTAGVAVALRADYGSPGVVYVLFAGAGSSGRDFELRRITVRGADAGTSESAGTFGAADLPAGTDRLAAGLFALNSPEQGNGAYVVAVNALNTQTHLCGLRLGDAELMASVPLTDVSGAALDVAALAFDRASQNIAVVARGDNQSSVLVRVNGAVTTSTLELRINADNTTGTPEPRLPFAYAAEFDGTHVHFITADEPTGDLTLVDVDLDFVPPPNVTGTASTGAPPVGNTTGSTTAAGTTTGSTTGATANGTGTTTGSTGAVGSTTTGTTGLPIEPARTARVMSVGLGGSRVQQVFTLSDDRAVPASLSTFGLPPAPSEPSSSEEGTDNTLVIVLASVGGFLGLLCLAGCAFALFKYKDALFGEDDPEAKAARKAAKQNGHGGHNSVEMDVPSAIATPAINDAYQQLPDGGATAFHYDNWQLRYSDLQMDKEIGRGAYGIVFVGSYQGQKCAVKQLKADGKVADAEVEEFKAEADLMKTLKPHPNVVLLLGVTFPPDPICVVLEFVENGCLWDYLASDAEIPISFSVIMAQGIAAGMLHLHQEGVIHRDLAARNVLLTADMTPKISDFGMSRESNDDNTTKSETGPLKWMAPEAIDSRVYSWASDAWSYAVTVWESLARSIPYPGLDPVQAASRVCFQGLRLPIPPETPPVLAEVLAACWNAEPIKRPNFKSICQTLETIDPHEYDGISAY